MVLSRQSTIHHMLLLAPILDHLSLFPNPVLGVGALFSPKAHGLGALPRVNFISTVVSGLQ
jgi:hypothetical protein